MTVEEKIDIAKVSQFLSSNAIDKAGLFGGGEDLRLPRKLYMIRKNVEWMYDLDPSDDSLTATSNYLLALCGKYQFAASQIVVPGGSVAPISPAEIPDDLDFKVTATSIIATGETQVYFNGEDGMPDFRGYNLNFSRGGIVQNTTSLGDGSDYYAWNRTSGLFSIYGAARAGELFRIMPDIAGGVTTIEATNTPDTIILAADGTYTLAQGYMLWKITINPSAADDVKIGTTLAGDEIMLEKTMTPNVYGNNGVTADVFAESGNVTIYFTGFTAAATINIYLLQI